MRGMLLVCALAAGFVLVNQISAGAEPPRQRGAASAVVAGTISCNEFLAANVSVSTGNVPQMGIGSSGALGLQGEPIVVAASAEGSCPELVSTIAAAAPSACTLGALSEFFGTLQASFVCTGRASDVVAAVGSLATAVVSLPPPASP